MFAVIRHPDVVPLGTCPDTALEHHQALGWVRISDWRTEPDLFHLPDFAEAFADLDAPAPPAPDDPADEPPATPKAKTTKEK